jgi:hypothetical protein
LEIHTTKVDSVETLVDMVHLMDIMAFIDIVNILSFKEKQCNLLLFYV